MGTNPPIAPEDELDANPLARTIAMLRKRAEEERASMMTVEDKPAGRGKRRWPILAAIVLALGGAIGWSIAKSSAPHPEVLR